VEEATILVELRDTQQWRGQLIVPAGSPPATEATLLAARMAFTLMTEGWLSVAV